MLSGKLLAIAAITLLSSLPTALANMSWLASACENSMESYNLGCSLEVEFYPCRCASTIYIASVLNCIHSNVNNANAIEDAVSEWIGYCKTYADMSLTYSELDSIYKNAVATHNFTITTDLKNATFPLTTPIIFTKEELDISIRTVKTYEWELYSGTLFG